MIAWRKQGPALIGTIVLTDGRPAVVALVAGRGNPAGISLLISSGTGEAPVPVPFESHIALTPPAALIEILCMQERCFGDNGLPAPEEVAGWV